jgi:hypothetical protein
MLALRLATLCTDGERRTATLYFPNPRADNAGFPQPELVAPEGAIPGWDSPQGQFVRCETTPCARW